MPSTPEPPDINPYLASEVTDRVVDPLKRSKPGPVAVIFSVMTALAVACITFGVTFFFTCLGLDSTQSLNNEFGFALLILVSGITSVAAFVFTVWGFLKIVRAMKQ